MSEELERCYNAAVRILNFRFNSAEELRKKLTAKAFEREVIQATLERLRKEKWLDDERFAGAFVRTRQSQGRGQLRIRRELSAAGVDREVAAVAMAANRDEDAERESVTVLCNKKMAMIARRHGAEYARSAEGRKKIAAYLLRQGYEFALVLDVISTCIRQAAGAQPLSGD
jgi:Uncharacterized protein conserved in bacteria